MMLQGLHQHQHWRLSTGGVLVTTQRARPPGVDVRDESRELTCETQMMARMVRIRGTHLVGLFS